ncbi:hypothetical protein Indivirus_3_57 [Indivirus ILV1]|uniref:Uncharacterized protein n=1 Tax=Indivirus ILV1 TaxID=1977633 RepID=A0A1V0SDS4_9VIRU|nr:hypothetical protein Indivirus_3_57 [Indivirus ILV1]
MKTYNYLVQLDKLKNYSYIVNNVNNEDIAQLIYENFDKLDSTGKKKLLMKCLSDREIDRYLLKYELSNYNIKCNEELTLNEFEKKAINVINRYHWKAGGYKIEDSEWIIHRENSKSYEVLANELVFENTIDRSDINDEETEFYMDQLIRHLNSLGTNIEVEYRYKNKKNKTVKLLIWATDKHIIIPSDESHESIGL